MTNGHNGGVKTKQPSLMPLDDSDEAQPVDTPASSKVIRTEAFDQPVVLQQTSFWSRAIVWTIVGVTSFVVIWALVAKIEEAVSATGQLEPQEKVQAVQAPVEGVVKEILVEDGQRVKKGDILIRFDPTAVQAQGQSLVQVRNSLLQENQFYRTQLSGAVPPTAADRPSNLPPEMLSLTVNRSALLAENRLYVAQLGGASGANLSPEQRVRLQSGLSASQSLIAAARLEVAQLQQQFRQTEGQLASAGQTLAIDQQITDDIGPLVEEGGLGRIQLLRQQQEVMKGQAEVDRLTQEKQRLAFAIAQAAEKLQNTVSLSSNDLLNKMADNEKQIASIDSQLNKSIVENEKHISEIDSQLSQAVLTLKYQDLRAPVDGTVFDLQAKGVGFVANTSEPILKIVPTNALVANVYITNKDIGFVREGLPVDVRIDSFPFSEFGDINGKLVQIGSDALPPDQVHPFYRFPAKVELDQQFLKVNNREIVLQSGMSVTGNIKIRDRTVMSIFTDLFTNKVDSLKNVR